jgi:hypothetical protein
LALFEKVSPLTKERDVKRKLKDTDLWLDQINATSEKRTSKTSDEIFSCVNSFVLQCLSGGSSLGNFPRLIGESSKNFCLMLSYMTTLVIETDFNPRIINVFRDLVRNVHQESEFPPDLYPSELKRLVTLIGLPDQHKEQIRLVINQEILHLLSTHTFLTKIFLLLFPNEANLSFNSLVTDPWVPANMTVIGRLM